MSVSKGDVPLECPFSVRQIDREGSLFLIREKDKYGDYPNIYAKIISTSQNDNAGTGSESPCLIILCDTGSGTNSRLVDSNGAGHRRRDWNIGSFLEFTINPKNKIPYLIITSHCHYDHILGLNHLDLRMSTVLSSAYDKSFIVPSSHLAKHSQCNDLGIQPPEYKVGIWASDFQDLAVRLPHGGPKIATGITILQTPGHTPDSLTWYDCTLSPPHIFVGDSLYERQSEDTRNAKWGREPPMPTIFDINGNLTDWLRSMAKVIKFVRERNVELRTSVDDAEDDEWMVISQSLKRGEALQRVMLGAAHVTVAVDAEDCLVEMQEFMNRILNGQVPHCRVNDEKGYEVWLWDETLNLEDLKPQPRKKPLDRANFGRFSVQAPLFLVENEMLRIKQQRQCESIEDEDDAWSDF